MHPVNGMVVRYRRARGLTPGGRGPGTGVGGTSDEGDVPRRPEGLAIGRPRFGPPAVFRCAGAADDDEEDESSSSKAVAATAASWASKQASKQARITTECLSRGAWKGMHSEKRGRDQKLTAPSCLKREGATCERETSGMSAERERVDEAKNAEYKGIDREAASKWSAITHIEEDEDDKGGSKYGRRQ
jgi:hypothetical protein